MQLPQSFCQTVTAFHTDGAAWLAALPQQIAHFEQCWQIRVGEPFALSYNFAAAAVGPNNEPYVLKLGVPRGELTREIAALRQYAGRGICRLIAADAAAGALLLERIQPGDMLSTMADPDEAAQVGAAMMAALWQPLPVGHSFRPVEAWVAGFGRLRAKFDGGTGPLPTVLVDSAEKTFDHLFATAGASVLLHGDLHHYNILRDGDDWRVIDPKGMAGELAYETGTFVRNHFNIYRSQHEPQTLLERCIATLADCLAIPPQRIRQHAFAQAVLSALWSSEDGTGGEQTALELAHLLHTP